MTNDLRNTTMSDSTPMHTFGADKTLLTRQDCIFVISCDIAKAFHEKNSPMNLLVLFNELCFKNIEGFASSPCGDDKASTLILFNDGCEVLFCGFYCHRASDSAVLIVKENGKEQALIFERMGYGKLGYRFVGSRSASVGPRDRVRERITDVMCWIYAAGEASRKEEKTDEDIFNRQIEVEYERFLG